MLASQSHSINYTSVDLSSSNITKPFPSILSHLQSLTFLSFSNLKHFYLAENKFSRENLTIFGQFKQLEVLD